MRQPATVVHSMLYECDIGPHVFPMQKFRLIRERLVSEHAIDESQILAPEPAPSADLASVHTEAYLDDLVQLRSTQRTLASELPLSSGITRAYNLAAAGTTLAAREAMRRGVGINLGGGFHHAYADHAEGFCYINDLAVAIRVLQRDGAIRRAAVVDLDVHQGNGTAHIFSDDPDVFTLSIHQESNYPTPKERSDLDVGLDDGTRDDEYLDALARAMLPVWDARPELVLYQAGADPYIDDQLGGLALTLEGLAERDRRVLEGCVERSIPVVVTLGGGYARRLEDTVAIHTRTCRTAIELARDSTRGRG